ncbi:MAG: NAD(P)H-hydrate dehydratase, partial [Clostridia bacterium]|nr:NAD(P)H-hydrate dehydratase [Clostridia bacterium]
ETIAISTLKPLHTFYPGRGFCGDVLVLSFGLLPASFETVAPKLLALAEEEAGALLPLRSRTAHKNDAGHILSLCGSYKMPGAACLAAGAALRAGAGLLTAAYPEPAYPAISAHLTEAMSLPLPADGEGQLSVLALPEILKAMETRSVLAAGPGLGRSPELSALLKGLLEQCSKPMVLDADALNNLAGDLPALKAHEGPLVITPHPGEMARLTGLSVSEVQKDRPGVAKRLADELGITVLLKGPDTVIASPETEELYVNLTGNEGLAKGGSGDTLTGILAAFLAQGMSSVDAAACAAFYHGKAAAFCGETMARRSILATDLIEALPYIL